MVMQNYRAHMQYIEESESWELMSCYRGRYDKSLPSIRLEYVSVFEKWNRNSVGLSVTLKPYSSLPSLPLDFSIGTYQ